MSSLARPTPRLDPATHRVCVRAAREDAETLIIPPGPRMRRRGAGALLGLLVLGAALVAGGLWADRLEVARPDAHRAALSEAAQQVFAQR